METDGNHNAYPLQYHDEDNDRVIQLGLSKREYFAAMAMQGLCADSTYEVNPFAEKTAALAVACADALINELNK